MFRQYVPTTYKVKKSVNQQMCEKMSKKVYSQCDIITLVDEIKKKYF